MTDPTKWENGRRDSLNFCSLLIINEKNLAEIAASDTRFFVMQATLFRKRISP